MVTASTQAARAIALLSHEIAAYDGGMPRGAFAVVLFLRHLQDYTLAPPTQDAASVIVYTQALEAALLAYFAAMEVDDAQRALEDEYDEADEDDGPSVTMVEVSAGNIDDVLRTMFPGDDGLPAGPCPCEKCAAARRGLN